MALAYIGLGSNLSDNVDGHIVAPQAQLNKALNSLSSHRQINLVTVSSFYQTPPIGPGEQADYINAAAKLETQLTPLQLLDYLQSIEQQQGRVRNIRWGARTLDLDILLYNQLVQDCDRLTLPHQRMRERGFVLAPLTEIEPQLSLPNGENIAALLANCSMQGIVKL
ncbi:MAG: 2-amino-4-hydroxy-6-hydroxymethyldihydropteridine diphosphokinase [Porticoccaceae bacterium]|jgi:2-amino-4-hydroxy-6-hydroxymethyldihydropteridine diphosphokinase|nr:2-amino-4-hydroxy-6-hydroxymethyldihydropteridine diphosphokinase [Porticoccaceae bacterium]